MDCDYLSNNAVTMPLDHGQAKYHTLPLRRGRPPNNSRSIANIPTPTTSESDCSQSPIPSGDDTEPFTYAPCLLDAQSLELFHHYLCRTAPTLGDAQVFRDVVPPLGFKYDCVMRMILSMAARHVARLRPDQAAFYGDLADQHATAALPEVTTMLAQLNDGNFQALYYATVLICFSSFAKDPTPGNLLIVADDGEVPWWSLMRGVRIVVRTVGIKSITATAADSLLTDMSVWDDIQFSTANAVSGVLLWEQPFAEVADLVAEMAVPGEETHMVALDHLRECFREAYGSSEDPKATGGGRSHLILAWLYVLEDDFIQSFKNRHPVALLLLAYFAVVLRALEHHWFIENWPFQIVTGISRILEARYMHLLRWPMEQIRSGQPVK